MTELIFASRLAEVEHWASMSLRVALLALDERLGPDAAKQHPQLVVQFAIPILGYILAEKKQPETSGLDDTTSAKRDKK